MARSQAVQLDDKRGMEQASKYYRPPFLDIEEIRRQAKSVKRRGRVN